MRSDDGANDLPAAFHGNYAAMVLQFTAWHGIDAIAFAKCRPIHAIGFIQQHFVVARRSRGALRRAIEDFDEFFAGGAGRV